MLNAEEYRQKKINFWLVWTLGNAFGAAMGWTFGEIIGRIVSEAFGVKIGLSIAALSFEASIWIPRMLIFHHYQDLKPIKFLDEVVWVITEGFVWVVIETVSTTNVTYFTLGASFSIIWGAMISMFFSITGLAKARKSENAKKKVTDWWLAKTFIFTLLGFIILNVIFSFIITTAMEISDMFQKINSIIGWILAGLAFGAGVGAITGLGYVNLISRRDSMLS
jgi:hypothetical protein